METASPLAYRRLFANDVHVLDKTLKIILQVGFCHAWVLSITTSLLFLQIVVKILDNPGEQRYRDLKFTNVTFRKSILEVPGALEFLKEKIGLSGSHLPAHAIGISLYPLSPCCVS